MGRLGFLAANPDQATDVAELEALADCLLSRQSVGRDWHTARTERRIRRREIPAGRNPAAGRPWA
jgi:hypothetical protein